MTDQPDNTCFKCMGERKVANSDDQEPWSAWENLPPESKLAIHLEIVQPIDCPECDGTGVRPTRDTTRLAKPADDPAPLDPGELRKRLIEDMTTWYWGRYISHNAAELAANAMSALESCGIWPGELNRLRRIEAALVELGAPNRSEPGDPGGLVISWVKGLVAGNKLLRDELARQAEQDSI